MYSHEATLYAEPNYYRILTRTPNDLVFGGQWNLRDNGNGTGCQFAWDASVGLSTIKVGMLDTGIDYNHNDLGGGIGPNYKIAGGYDFADDDSDPMDHDPDGHGTATAGIVGALTNNETAVAGMAGGWNQGPNDKGVKLYAAKIFSDGGNQATDKNICKALWKASDPDEWGCQILSNSWGGYYYSEAMRQGINWGYRVGISFVAAKGNWGDDGYWYPFMPADYGDRSMITSVGAYGTNGRYYNGQCGTNWESNYGGGIDILAPGCNIYTTNRNQGVHEYFAGTSAACPHVAGAIALIKSNKPGLRNEDTDWMIKFSAYDPIHPSYSDGDVWTWSERYGHGDLRISTAMLRLGHPLVHSGYELIEHTATGAYEYGHTEDLLPYTFMRHPLNGRNYHVRRYDVRVPVTYPEEFEGIPFVWGVGHNSIGWSGANPNYQSGFAIVVPGSQSATGCELRTFVYEIFDDGWNWLGWFPCEVEEVSLKYRVWGVPKEGEPDRPEGPKVEFGKTPQVFALKSVYPNPFNSSVLIEFSLPSDEYARVDIFDLLGRKVVTLLNGKTSGGDYSVVWTGKNRSNEDVPTGIYFCMLTAGNKTITRKVSLLR